ncbi:ufm1-specific protease 2 [Anopheles ziemanni]|uniref:ufm1-specific protease 2 n=1 Tax=Anopheles coustani TaxID=139045 RepID=UPI00265AAB7C|nr:ufm1-specific protease 2 [Anopheles coustani]XP_058129612.1 ufm1-specific protease 2 [Anopheles coustani]XP_058171861.1 ufm1-specific protease 2 [Anopheles ziemanni]
MAEKIRISEFVMKRICSIKAPCTGELYGTMCDGVPTIVAFSKIIDVEDGSHDDASESPPTKETIQPNLPCGIDLFGWVRIGPCEDPSGFLQDVLRDLVVTDNPVFLHSPGDGLTLQTYIYQQRKLVKVECTIVEAGFLYREFYLLRLRCTMSIFCEQTEKSISESAFRLRKRLASGNVAFNVPAIDDVMLSENVVTGVGSEESIEMLHAMMLAPKSEKDDGFGVPGARMKVPKKPHTGNQNVPLTGYRVIDVGMLIKKSKANEDEKLRREACNVMIDSRSEDNYVKIPIQVDCLSMVHREKKLEKCFNTLVDSVCCSLSLIESALLEQLDKTGQCYVTKCFHMLPRELGHFVTCAYPIGSEVQEEQTYLRQKRMLMHAHFGLSKHRPYFRKANAYRFQTGKLLLNPHETLTVPYPDGKTAVVDGAYTYHHYLQDDFDDKGWGCAYRSLQTLVSWFNIQGYSANAKIPSHTEIQKCLVRVGDKQPNFVGSRQWIGSTEVSICLNEFVGIDSRIQHVASGAELVSLGRELLHHFHQQGTPIMIGGGVLAHTILGVSIDADDGGTKFLILDPHYTGADELGPVLAKGWCGWKGGDFWDKKSYYNLCMPQRPALM